MSGIEIIDLDDFSDLADAPSPFSKVFTVNCSVMKSIIGRIFI